MKMECMNTGYVTDIVMDEERMRLDGIDVDAFYSGITGSLKTDSEIEVISNNKFVAATPEADVFVIYVLKCQPNFLKYALKWEGWDVQDGVLSSDDLLEINRNRIKRHKKN